MWPSTRRATLRAASSCTLKSSPGTIGTNMLRTGRLSSCIFDLVHQRAARGKIRNACESGFQNRSKSLAGEEGLMPGQDYIGKGDEALNHVVRDHRARQILE